MKAIFGNSIIKYKSLFWLLVNSNLSFCFLQLLYITYYELRKLIIIFSVIRNAILQKNNLSFIQSRDLSKTGRMYGAVTRVH